MNKNGTYTTQPSDTTGLGEFSDAQLVKELVDRSVLEVVVGSKVPVTYFHGLLKDRQHQRIKELIGE